MQAEHPDPDFESVVEEPKKRANGHDKTASAEEKPWWKTHELFRKPWDDVSNSERLGHYLGERARYCYESRSWYLWDGLSRWKRDDSGMMVQEAKGMLEDLYRIAYKIEDPKELNKILQGIVQSRASWKIDNMLALLQSESNASFQIPVRLEELDSHPMLFNCINGTLDLETGKLRSAREEDLLTKRAPVAYDPDARSKLWERVLHDATGGDRDLEAFLQRAAGYSLTGRNDEEKLFFVYGPTATGKSTVLEAITATFGEYAKRADFETFINRDYSGPRNDIARLAGDVRLAISIEVEQGRRLAEGLIKTLTGRDTIAARFLYHESFEFQPRFKLWLCANDAPAVNDEDSAIWRRILRIPFEHQVPEEERDPEVKRELCESKEQRAAILAWAVRGCLDWQENGLEVPDTVRDSTREYRAEMDPIAQFLEDCTVSAPNAYTASAELTDAYRTWAEKNGYRPLRADHFGRRLKAKGFTSGEIGHENRRVWRGVGLLVHSSASAK